MAVMSPLCARHRDHHYNRHVTVELHMFFIFCSYSFHLHMSHGVKLNVQLL